MKTPTNSKQYEIEKYHNLKTGIEKQREIYKQAKILGYQKQMCDAIENIKSDIKTLSKKNNGDQNIKTIEKVLNWYNTLDNQYMKKTPDGIKVIFPPDIQDKINNNLTIAYELCIEELNKLDLL